MPTISARTVSLARVSPRRGVIVSNRAKAFKRKDGTGISVAVEYEIALQPGVAIWVKYFEPKTDNSVRVEERFHTPRCVSNFSP